MSVARDHRHEAGPAWLDLRPVLAFAATFGVFFLDKSTEVRSVLRSWRGFLALGAVVAGCLVVSLALGGMAGRIASPSWLWSSSVSPSGSSARTTSTRR